ncbi:MAG: tRNA (N6-isopentenyl adenosine(37)-C2)-methylthiotransferase MiaB [Candidatus Zhuqueibacterota bacterium]
MIKFHIETYGCQMNKYDSELVAGILQREGYQESAAMTDADVILVNTCSVRETAEKRVFGRLDAIRLLKKQHPNLVIGVMGCMAMRLKDEIISRKPFVNFVMGPDNYRAVPEILKTLLSDENQHHLQMAEFDNFETYSELYPARGTGVSAWVAVMRGCNNFCSYCIVPYVRGRERSRPAKDIVREVQQLVREQFVEVALLGQNVNSYDDGENDFADLIARVAAVPGLKRVRFATSHPKDLSEKLLDAIADNPRICNHMHLPVQAGSDRILKLMNRNYTRSHYLKLIESARKKIDGIGLYSDVIVGFPGEDDSDFEQTVSLIERVEFDGIFVFKYSPREKTAASLLKETLSESEKVARIQRLNQIQDAITLQRNRRLIGQTVQILVEGSSKKARANQRMGRTETNKIVVFDSVSQDVGVLRDVRITAAEGHTLFGEVVEPGAAQ